MLKVDRKLFCRWEEIEPYHDKPHSIGLTATISSPHMHAIALEALADRLLPGNSALDLGSGSGFITTVMATMVATEDGKGVAVGVDHDASLVTQSERNTMKAAASLVHKRHVRYIVGDGRRGAEKYAPYDAIHCGAAVHAVPESLVAQLKLGGKMVIPIQIAGTGEQNLMVIERKADDSVEEKLIMRCVFSQMQANPPAKEAPKGLTVAEVETEIHLLSSRILTWREGFKRDNGRVPSLQEMEANELMANQLKQLSIARNKLTKLKAREAAVAAVRQKPAAAASGDGAAAAAKV
jgi:protein-L-isoaspartate(D-aspartate) O-methyltransferase